MTDEPVEKAWARDVGLGKTKLEVKQTWPTRVVGALVSAIVFVALVAVLVKTCEVAWAWVS